VSTSTRGVRAASGRSAAVPLRPGWLTDRSWQRFLAVDHDRRRIAEVARSEGVSSNAIWQSVRKARAAVRAVDRASAG
jgi:hypothetical protein